MVVGVVIVGIWFGVFIYGNENFDVFNFVLDEDDLIYINEVVFGDEMCKLRVFYDKIGDCGYEYYLVYWV